ncbi:MAG TPA: DNA repair protein RadA [Nitrospiria bacterium]|nr:DNA repair protein RadA [Nitrospiria bacterium]
MPRPKTSFVCQNCGYSSPKWLGKCPDCNQWNSLQEESAQASAPSRWMVSDQAPQKPEPIVEIVRSSEDRFSTGMSELDRVLGGGVVAGSMVLIGGDPGIGKSTLLLQAFQKISQDRPVLYVSGEESPHQIKIRGERLGVDSKNLLILSETSLEEILKTAQSLRPRAMVIDSIQTVYTGQITSAPGSVSQIRESAAQLMIHAKQTNTPTFLVGHVTKDGSIAGPRILEHMVDTVLYFEGDKGHPYRILRAVKNRFGSTNEIGVFEMKSLGLEEVSNPSELFLSERPSNVAGSVVVSSIEGTRPILVELQALISPTNFGLPRRMAIGVDPNRVSLLLAVLEKRAGLQLQGQDVFINVVGGMQIDEPAVDLGIVAAVASGFRERPLDPKILVLGEVGLGGEVRAIHQADARLREAAKMGFKQCLLPERNRMRLDGVDGIDAIGVGHIRQALEVLFGK